MPDQILENWQEYTASQRILILNFFTDYWEQEEPLPVDIFMEAQETSGLDIQALQDLFI